MSPSLSAAAATQLKTPTSSKHMRRIPGERFLISSITRDMDVEKCAKFVKKAGHAVLSFTPMGLNLARELNRRLYDYSAEKTSSWT